VGQATGGFKLQNEGATTAHDKIWQTNNHFLQYPAQESKSMCVCKAASYVSHVCCTREFEVQQPIASQSSTVFDPCCLAGILCSVNTRTIWLARVGSP